MIELQTVTTKAKNPSTNEFQDVTWGGINVLSTSGTTNYNNLINKPTINGVTVQGSLTTGDLLITAANVGALPSGTKYGADFALSIDSQTFIVTAQLKDQDGNNLGQAKTIDLPLETMVVGGRYDDTTQKIILILKNGQTVEFSVADLVNGLQSEITLNNKLDADLIDDSASTNKLVTASEKATWNAKQNALTFDGTYNASTNKAATVSTVTNAINDLDVSSVGGSGKYISAISETNGKISPTVETMDTTPTSGSEKAVTSGAVYTALASKQDELTEAQLAAANSGITASKLTADEAALVEVVDSGAKNIADMGKTNFTTATSNGVTVSRNGDVFTINGTSDTNDNIFFNIYYKDLSTNMVPAGDWVASITPTNSNIRLRGGIDGSITKFADYGAPLIYTIPEGTTNNWVRIVAKASTTFNNETFRLMICTKAEWDVSHTYEPYALSNPVITSALIEQVDNGAKNHLYCDVSVMKSVNTNGTWSGNAFTHNSGVTFTINSDSSITVNGTASDVNGVFVLSTDFTISQGDWILSGTPTGGSSSTYNITIAGVISDIGNTARFSSATNKLVRIYVIAGTTVNNLLFKPMICSADDWAISQAYVPYGKTNPELTTLSEEDRAAIVELVNSGGKNCLPIRFTTKTYKGIDIKNNGDGTITLDKQNTAGTAGIGVADLSSNASSISEGRLQIPEGNYVVSCGFSGSDTGLQLQVYKTDGTTNVNIYTGNDAGTFVYTDSVIYPYIVARLSIGANASFNNLILKPMICTAADWAVSHKFVPYRPSWQEMYEMIQALQSGTRSVPALAMAEPEEIKEPEIGEEEQR